jgi:hypothetical protein
MDSGQFITVNDNSFYFYFSLIMVRDPGHFLTLSYQRSGLISLLIIIEPGQFLNVNDYIS